MDEECECNEGAPAWMATFSDLATLLLTFFVLLLSFAEMDITEFKVMLGSIKDAFGVQTVNPGPFHASSTSPIELMDRPTSLAMPLNDMEATLMRPIRRYIDEHGLQDSVEVLASPRGIIVRLRDKVLFESGSDRVKLEGEEILDHIAALAGAFPQGLAIEGHTDDRPIHTGRFPSNWELSTARATAVLRHMQRGTPLPVRALQVVGFADTMPLGPNDSHENRARNRRVEFVFERPLTEEANDAALREAAAQGSTDAGAGDGDGSVSDAGVPGAATADGGQDAE